MVRSASLPSLPAIDLTSLMNIFGHPSLKLSHAMWSHSSTERYAVACTKKYTVSSQTKLHSYKSSILEPETVGTEGSSLLLSFLALTYEPSLPYWGGRAREPVGLVIPPDNGLKENG